MRLVLTLLCCVVFCGTAGAQKTSVAGTVTIEQHGKNLRDRSGAVIWLTPLDGSAVPAVPDHVFHLAQKNKHFDPHLLVIPQGAEVEFPNKDPFFHNVFSLYEGVRFDLGLYERGASKAVRFNRPGASYIFC